MVVTFTESTKDFWKRFRANYLNELCRTNLYQRSNVIKNNITQDDVVLIKGDDHLLHLRSGESDECWNL